MYTFIQKSVERLDARSKVTGEAIYGADVSREGMLYGQMVFSPSPNGQILGIKTSRAKKVKGVIEVLTASHVPGSNNLFGRFQVFAKERFRYIGEGVALVIGEDKEAAYKGALQVQVQYQELPPLFTIDEALAKDALPLFPDKKDNIIENSCHQLIKGDVQEGFSQCDLIIERTYETQFVEHAYLEAEAIVAIPSNGGEDIIIYGSIQNPFSIRANVALALGIEESRIRVKTQAVGGSFGGKDESVMLMAARAAIAALKTKRPVQLLYSREESILESPKRHPYRFHFKAGVMKDGRIVALESEVIAKGGAYNNKAQFCNWRVVIHTSGPYAIPHIKTKTKAVYTNTIYSGAMRGFSSPQNIFAIESLIDEIALELNLDPLTMREINMLKAGDTLPTGVTLGGKIPASLKDLVEELVKKANYQEKYQEYLKDKGPIRRGIGLALSFRGAGLGAESLDATGAYLSIQGDGSILLASGLTDNGQGLKTVHSQIAAEVLGLSPSKIHYLDPDTSTIPDGGPTVASRGTMTGGRAVYQAALKVKEKLFQLAGEILKTPPLELYMKDEKIISPTGTSLSYKELVGEASRLGIVLTAFSWFNPGVAKLDHRTNQGEAFPTYSWNGVIAEVEVDMETGLVVVKKVVSAHDVGRAINPDAIRGQVYGGIAMGLGMGLFEEVQEREGVPLDLNLDSYLIPTIMDMPEMEVIILESHEEFGPFGAKSLGEPACEVPAAAISNAVAHATCRRIRQLPLSLERVLGVDGI